MARRSYKQALGLWHHPLERPLFAIAASLAWAQQVYFWKPISDCAKWSPYTVNPYVWFITVPVLVRRQHHGIIHQHSTHIPHA